jgi:hypothetical protein
MLSLFTHDYYSSDYIYASLILELETQFIDVRPKELPHLLVLYPHSLH